LIAQFLSPFSNRRLDEYGGGMLGRARFALEIVRKVRQTVGDDFPILFRISGDEFVEGGLTITDTKMIAPMLVEAGVDIISVTAGNYATPGGILVAPMDVDTGVLVPLAAEIKKSVSVPVMAVDRIHNPLLAEQVLNEGKADLIGIGRALLTDPELPNKAQRGDIDDIYLCISCNQACIDYLFAQKPISCLLNPACGREREFELKRADQPKKVVVVGGGPAGMEAARIAALRGHNVTLLEQGDHLAGEATLGGDFAIASVPPKKEELAGAITWMIQHVHSAGAKIETGVKAAPDYVAQLKPDVAIIATGADPMLPAVPGIDRPEVIMAQDVLLGKKNPGARVLVVGGGLVGVDVAEFCVIQGKQVTIMEMLDTIGAGLGSYRHYWVMRTLAEHGTCFMPNTKLLEIMEDGVKVEVVGEQQTLCKFDSIIIATGYRPSGQPFAGLKSSIPVVHVIGDAAETRTAVEAIYEGSKIAREI
jgi:NADPH-dependent 2,4-dienoyl-CoA reductase/sulfur reductase-like enzyme